MSTLSLKNDESLFEGTKGIDPEEAQTLVAWGLRHGLIHPPAAHVGGQPRCPIGKKQFKVQWQQFDSRQQQPAVPALAPA